MISRILYFMYHHPQSCIVGEEQTQPSPDSFALFSLPPYELRLKIWEIIPNMPRRVELTCTPATSNILKGQWFSNTKNHSASAPNRAPSHNPPTHPSNTLPLNSVNHAAHLFASISWQIHCGCAQICNQHGHAICLRRMRS